MLGTSGRWISRQKIACRWPFISILEFHSASQGSVNHLYKVMVAHSPSGLVVEVDASGGEGCMVLVVAHMLNRVGAGL